MTCGRCIRVRARTTIAQMVADGVIPAARTLRCTDCDGEAAEYDHAHGYDPPSDVYVEPVCRRCHGQRNRSRGERKNAGPAVYCPTCPTPLSAFRLEPDVLALLDERAAALGVTRTDAVRGIVREAIIQLAQNGNRPRPARCTRTPACLPRATAPWLLVSPALALQFCGGCRRRWAEAMLGGMLA